MNLIEKVLTPYDTAAGFLSKTNVGPGSSLQFNPSNTLVTTKKGDKLGPIQCTATCNPPCQFNWTKPDKSIINNGELMINSLSIDDHGTFICTASNGIGDSHNKNIHVTVNYGPEYVSLLPPDTTYTVKEGNNLLPISCMADCKPVCTYTWYGPNIPVGTSNILSLQNIHKTHRGVFNCTASNVVGSFESSDVNIDVQFGPGSSLLFDPYKTSVTKTKGEQFGPFECSATCNPSCLYKWAKPDKSIINNSVLVINSVRTVDHGSFMCTASNGIGDSQNKTLHVTVNYGPAAVTLSPSTKQYTVTHGENVAPINCTAKCRPECKYTWFGPHVPSGIKNVLSLENIKKNQSGDFNCTATNVVGSMQSAIINVNVQYEPFVNRVTINGTNFTVSENTTVTLACNYEGNPAPKMTWKKNNIILGEDGENNGRSFYTINTVRCKDTGNYSCVANNSLGMSSAQQSMFVTCFPRLNAYIQQPPRRMRLSIGTNLNLTVGIIAYPKLLQVNWNFQPSTSSNDDRKNNYTTSLKSDLFTHVAYFYKYNLEKGDFGNYTLEIQNDIGGIVVHFYVDLAGLPDPPTDLLAICEKSPMVVLWKPGFNGGSPQWFTVIWEDLKTNTSIVKSSIPDFDNGQYVKVTTSSLSDGTTYIIHVEASNKYGRHQKESSNAHISFIKVKRGPERSLTMNDSNTNLMAYLHFDKPKERYRPDRYSNADGEFSISQKPGAFNDIWSDMATEKTIIKGCSGIIGLTRKKTCFTSIDAYKTHPCAF
ncbi:unnamed protein product [Mytilus coruscus]|uniref:HMCN n=1 Tax=Mytilus coruscus TaxID=42192 RepID=A0A6J8A290_MYTCO|nr:unnamed protein product [Mytilus coruscus]